MVIFALILLVLAILVGIAISATRSCPPVEPIRDEPQDDLSPTELAATDPVEALLRFGSPDDAARLGEQGVDLGGLGYRPPGE